VSSTYKDHTFNSTAISTPGAGRVYEIEGAHGKSARCRPFLTSIAACRRYVNTRIDLALFNARANQSINAHAGPFGETP